MMLLAVGQDYPGAVPVAELGGGVFEVSEDGLLSLTVQMPNPSPEETAALKEGFSHYALYVSPYPPYVALWIWKFPAPVGYMETPFHAGVYQDGRMENYLTLPETDNLLTTIVLDGQKIALLRASGLTHAAIEAFHLAVKRQGAISREDYEAALEKEYKLTSKEMFRRGVSWAHRMVEEKKQREGDTTP